MFQIEMPHAVVLNEVESKKKKNMTKTWAKKAQKKGAQTSANARTERKDRKRAQKGTKGGKEHLSVQNANNQV